jgi:hypothetical protein
MVAEPHFLRSGIRPSRSVSEDLLASVELTSWLERLAAVERDWQAACMRPNSEVRSARVTRAVETECLMIELEERFGAGLVLRIVHALTERGLPAVRVGLG